jgi:hypothetical protein
MFDLGQLVGLDPGGPILQFGGQHDLQTVHHKKWCEVSRPVGHCPHAPEYRGDLSGPLPNSGVEPGMDVLAFL